jgi:hypothetical protein
LECILQAASVLYILFLLGKPAIANPESVHLIESENNNFIFQIFSTYTEPMRKKRKKVKTINHMGGNS